MSEYTIAQINNVYHVVHMNTGYFSAFTPNVLGDTPTLGNCDTVTSCAHKHSYSNQEEGNTPMTTYNETPDQRRHLLSRLTEVYEEKLYDAKEFFRLEPVLPKNFSDAIERIKTGKFTLTKDRAKFLDGKKYFDAYDLTCIDWSDPSNPADEEGFEAAKEALEKDFTAAKDVVKILPVEEGLKAVQAMEAKTYH